ncbi:MAG: hypothetical protein V4510_07550 [bacterium]
MKRAVLCVAAVAALSLSGCLEPFRAQVEPSALRPGWTVKEGPEETHGAFGPNKVDVEYKFETSGGPPYPGHLLVVSLRQAGGFTSEELDAAAQDFLDAAAKGLTLARDKSLEGERFLRNGLHTHWFVREGTVVSSTANPIFKQDATVRLIAEVGYDGLSGTAVAAVGEAQIGSGVQCALIGPCSSPQSDLTTWNRMVGDRAGSIGKATDDKGMIDHLVTHG